MKAGIPGTATREEYLVAKLQPGDQVGVDAQTISHDTAVKLSTALQNSKIKLNLMDENLVDMIWSDRPTKVQNPVFHLPDEYSGMGLDEKIAALQRTLGVHRAFLVTALDEVACKSNHDSMAVNRAFYRAFQSARIGYQLQPLFLFVCSG